MKSGYHCLLHPNALRILLLLFFTIHRHLGKVAFVGTVHYAKGTYVGVVMDIASVGKNNGSYFLIMC